VLKIAYNRSRAPGDQARLPPSVSNGKENRGRRDASRRKRTPNRSWGRFGALADGL